MESLAAASGAAPRTKKRVQIAMAVVLLLAAGAAYYGIQRYRYRFVRTDVDLLRFLPAADVTRFYLDAATLRKGGCLRLLNESKSEEAPEYLQFVRETGFDYSRDVDGTAGAADRKQWWFALRGRFHWGKLEAYAKEHGGHCEHELCSLPGSEAGRWISYKRVQPDVLLLAVSTDSEAADQMRRAEAEPAAPNGAPVWVKPAHQLLTNPSDLPLGLRLFAISLQSADSVVISLRQAERKADAFVIELDGAFPNESTAETAGQQLQIDTGLAKAELTREHKQVNPADLTGLVTAGTFHAAHRSERIRWPD